MKLRATLVVAAAIFLALVSYGLAADQPTKLFVAQGAISNDVTPMWFGKDRGIFKKYNLDIDNVFIIAGRAAQAMLAGQVPVGLIGATHVTNAVTAGGDLTMVLGMKNRLDYLFVARPSIKTGADLKGKKVAIGTPSGSASLATYVALDFLGLVPKRDNITLLGVGGNPERLAALRSGSVDATSLAPEMGPALKEEGYRILVDEVKENIPFQSAGVVFTRKYMKSNPVVVESFAKAIVESVAAIHNPENKRAVLQTIAKYLKLDKPERAESAYADLVVGLPRKPCPSLEGIASVLKLLAMHGINPKASQLKPEDVADMSVCKKLEDSGFFAQVGRGA
ncbi:MAG TPA: ABC transporter substrate-binding protein [Verrucomicrobiae bacterium]|nr:ABC transporter substrate-binding protein [Verrucomicrobiae bacterium]